MKTRMSDGETRIIDSGCTEGCTENMEELVCATCGLTYNIKTESTVCPHVYKGEIKDIINHPPHYTQHPSGVECIDITEHMNFNCGSVIKYVWRADLKGNAIEDLKKAEFYIKREIKKREKLKCT